MATPKMSGIYAIVNTINGKRYIGSAVNIQQRWRQHRSDLTLGKHHSRALQRAWLKYGAVAFEFRVIEECVPELLIEREQSHLDTGPREYNCSPTAGSSLGVARDQAFRQRMSAARSGVPLSEAHRAAIGAALRGLKRAPEAVEKSAAARRGKKRGPLSSEHRSKISAAQRGKKHPPEFGEAISRGKTGKPRPDMVGNKYGARKHSEAERLVNSTSKKGRPKSAAARANMLRAQTPELRALRAENFKRYWAERRAAAKNGSPS